MLPLKFIQIGFISNIVRERWDTLNANLIGQTALIVGMTMADNKKNNQQS